MVKKLFSFLSKHDNVPQDIKPMLLSLQQLPVATCVIDLQGEIVFANKQLLSLAQVDENALQHQSISSLGLALIEVQGMLAKPGVSRALDIVWPGQTPQRMDISASVIGNLPYIMICFTVNDEQNRLHKEKQFFESIVNHYPFAVLVQDITGVCLSVNEQFKQLFGTEEPQPLGQLAEKLFPAEIKEELATLDKNLWKQKEKYISHQLQFTDHTGKLKILSITKVSLSGPNNIQAILTVFEDITVRHEQEEQLEHTRSLLQAILDNIPLGVYTRTVFGDMTYFNKQSMEILGQQNEQYVNSPHPKQTENTVRGYSDREQQILSEGKLQDYPEEEYIDEQGNKRLIHMIKVPLFKAGPEPLVLSIVEDVTKKREQEREIVTANNFLHAILDNLPIAVYARSKNRKILLSNKAAEEIFKEEAKDSILHETVEQAAGYLHRETEILEKGIPLIIEEEPYTAADGRSLILRMIKVPVKDAFDTPAFVVTMAEDITARKQQEKNLEEIRLFQQAVLDNVPVAIYAYDPNGKKLFCNNATNILFNNEQEETRMEASYNTRDVKLFTTKELLDIPQEEYVTQTGEKLLLHLVKAPVFTKEGEPLMILTVAEDITQKKEQEKEIVKARQFLQKVVDNLPVALSVKKSDGLYVLWNKRSEEVFGVEAADVIGKDNYRTDITKEQAEFMAETDKRVFESHRELNIAQELISTPKEGVKIMHTVKTPLYTPQGASEYLLSVSEDITAKTKMEKQIRENGEKNSLLVENAREGIVMLEDRKIIYTNRAVYQLLGFDRAEDIMGRRLTDFMTSDYQIFAKEKYDTVINQLPGSETPITLRFINKAGAKVDIELSAMSSKYLGRRIVIAFLRDVTTVNKTIRQTRLEREKYKNAFVCAPTPAIILNSKGYIDRMNKAAQQLFGFTDEDRHFYRNVYLRPAFDLAVRQAMQKGLPAQMDYQFDFMKIQSLFPGRIRKQGILNLHLIFEPFNIRSNQEGNTEADYLVSIFRQNGSGHDLSPESLPQKEQTAPQVEVLTTSSDPDLLAEAASWKGKEPTPSQEISAEVVGANSTLTLSQSSRNWIQMLEEVKFPAVVINMDYEIDYANTTFLTATGLLWKQVEHHDFFEEFIASGSEMRQAFTQAALHASGSAFQVQMTLKEEHNKEVMLKWDVFVMRNVEGQPEGYGLIGMSQK